MRIFITSESSAKRTRIFIDDCSNTSQLINKICKQIGANRNQIIVKLKYEPYSLIIIEDWPLDHYPIRNGSIFIVQFNFRQRSQQSLFSSTNPINQIVQDVYQSFYETTEKLSFVSTKLLIQGSNGQVDDGKQLQESLNKLLNAIRCKNLEEISEIFNQQPIQLEEGQLERHLERRYEYLLNELGEYGRNALHEAIQVNSLDMVSYLILKGADPTILTVDQFSPIQLAIVYRAPQILSILLQQKKVNVNQVTAHGTALHLAISNEEIKCIQFLFQNDADIQTRDLDGRRAIDRANNIKLKEFLQNRSEIKRVHLPNITKGYVYSVVSLTDKLKGNILVINPYKNQIIFLKQSNEIDAKFPITFIQKAQNLQQGSLQLQSSLFYLKLSLKRKEGKHVVFGVRNSKIMKKWIESIEAALHFREISMYVKPIPYSQQLIELLDDASNQIFVYKRDIQRLRQSRMSYNSNICQDYQVGNYARQTQKLNSIKHEDVKGLSTNDSQQRQKTVNIESHSKIQCINKSQKLISVQASTVKSSQSNSQQISSESQFLNKSTKKMPITEKKAQSTQLENAVSFRDFKIIKMVGNGAFGEVYSAINIKNDKVYALKVLNKKKLMSKKQLRYAVGQVNILKKVNFPFIIDLLFAFQTPLNIYLALDSCTYGDLSELITIKQKLSQQTSKFIIAQIILDIEYIHNRNILYRDLKPDNILIASDGYIRLTDFGLSKQDCFSMSFCGSPAYLSPQMLDKNGVGFSNDIYGIGCVLYEMVVGQPPFFDQKLEKLFENIKSSKLLFPKGISPQLKSLLTRLLQRDINNRIGVNDFAQIKDHIFFKEFDWNNLLSKKLVPPSQMFANDQSMNFQPQISVENLEPIRLDDADYDECPDKAARIKNFTFVKNGELNRKKL